MTAATKIPMIRFFEFGDFGLSVVVTEVSVVLMLFEIRFKVKMVK
jgi:hypothetical protein